MNAGGHGSDMAATLARGSARRPGDGRGWRGARGRPRPRLPALVDVAPHQRGRVGRPGAWRRATPRPGEAEIAEIVRWRRENQPGGQNAGSVFTNPPGDSAGRLIDAAGCKGLRRRAPPRCRPSTPTSSRPTTAARPTTWRRSWPRSGGGWRRQAGVDLHAETRLVGFDPRSWPCERRADGPDHEPPPSAPTGGRREHDHHDRTGVVVHPRMRPRRIEVRRDAGRRRLRRAAVLLAVVVAVLAVATVIRSPLLDVDRVEVTGGQDDVRRGRRWPPPASAGATPLVGLDTGGGRAARRGPAVGRRAPPSRRRWPGTVEVTRDASARPAAAVRRRRRPLGAGRRATAACWPVADAAPAGLPVGAGVPRAGSPRASDCRPRPHDALAACSTPPAPRLPGRRSPQVDAAPRRRPLAYGGDRAVRHRRRARRQGRRAATRVLGRVDLGCLAVHRPASAWRSGLDPYAGCS